MVALDEYARFMLIWIRGLAPLPRDIYIVVWGFPQHHINVLFTGTQLVTPYLDLYAGVIQYSVIGEIIFVGNFNACTRAR